MNRDVRVASLRKKGPAAKISLSIKLKVELKAQENFIIKIIMEIFLVGTEDVPNLFLKAFFLSKVL